MSRSNVGDMSGEVFGSVLYVFLHVLIVLVIRHFAKLLEPKAGVKRMRLTYVNPCNQLKIPDMEH